MVQKLPSICVCIMPGRRKWKSILRDGSVSLNVSLNWPILDAKQEVVLIGVQDHAEIWSTERRSMYLKSHGPHLDEMASQAFGQMPW